MLKLVNFEMKVSFRVGVSTLLSTSKYKTENLNFLNKIGDKLKPHYFSI